MHVMKHLLHNYNFRLLKLGIHSLVVRLWLISYADGKISAGISLFIIEIVQISSYMNMMLDSKIQKIQGYDHIQVLEVSDKWGPTVAIGIKH